MLDLNKCTATSVDHRYCNMFSKRRILSQVARIYDPIDFASAFLIRAKIGLQELWEKGVGWDEKLPSETQAKMDQPVPRNEEPQWHKLREMSDTALCSWPPCTLCFFLMPLKNHSVPAHMHDGSCRVESTTYDLLQQNQGLHR